MATRIMDEKAQMRRDFEQLQREYRNMEAMRKAYSEESLSIIKRQREMIEKLQKDNENLKTELDLETRYAQRKAASDTTIAQLNDQVDMYTQRVEAEKKACGQLERQLDSMKTKVQQQRRNMGGVNAAKENQAMVAKQIRILENRLDKALVKFNEALAENKELRREIDNLRRERFMFDKIYKRLEAELHKKKKDMAKIIELSNQAYEARDGAQLEIAAIQQQMTREATEFEEQILAYNRQLEASRRLPDDPSGAPRGNMTVEEEAELKKVVNAGQWTVAKDKVAVAATEERVQSFEQAWNKIHAATGISDIEELVSTFIHNEDQNFSLFNYVSEQNNEIERLEEQIQALRDEREKYSQESGEDASQHKQLLKDLEGKLRVTESAAEKYEMRFQEAQKTVNTLKQCIQSIFNKIDCSSSVMSEMLADTQVTENNMMQFLGMIEQRTNEILQVYAQQQNGGSPRRPVKSAAAAAPAPAPAPIQVQSPVPTPPAPGSPTHLASILGQGPTTQHGTIKLKVDPPQLDDYSSDEEESEDEGDARPLSMKELKDRTMKSITQRTGGSNRSGRGGGRGGRKVGHN